MDLDNNLASWSKISGDGQRQSQITTKHKSKAFGPTNKERQHKK